MILIQHFNNRIRKKLLLAKKWKSSHIEAPLGIADMKVSTIWHYSDLRRIHAIG